MKFVTATVDGSNASSVLRQASSLNFFFNRRFATSPTSSPMLALDLPFPSLPGSTPALEQSKKDFVHRTGLAKQLSAA